MWLRGAIAFPSKRRVISAVTKLPSSTPATSATPKLKVDPVENITYCRLSALGATKVSEATGAGLKGSAPR